MDVEAKKLTRELPKIAKKGKSILKQKPQSVIAAIFAK